MCDLPFKKLEAARERAGYSVSDFAERIGQKYSTYVHHENGTRNITLKAAKKYAAALQHVGLKVSDLVALDEEIDMPAGVRVMGDVAMGVWRDSALDEGQPRNRKTLPLPGGKKNESRRALHVLDDSVNKEIGQGEFAIYLPLPDDPGPLDQYAGKLLYVECAVKKLVERSIRMAVLQKDGRLKLIAHSRNPKYTGHMMYPCSNDAVTLLGKIVGKYAEFDD